jgi:hypothetical protein
MSYTPTSSLLGPTARPVVALGGANAWKQRSIKGILCSFQWLDLRQHGFENTPDHACVPCMCLFRPGSMARGAYVIPQPHAYLFATNKGGPSAHLTTSAFAIAETLGFDLRDRSAVRLAMDIILDGLPDLVDMPSEPESESDALVKQAVLGIEASAKINGKTIVEELL